MDPVLGQIIDNGIAGLLFEYMAQMPLADLKVLGDGGDADILTPRSGSEI